MSHIHKGCVSDSAPESYSMHIVTGRSKDGLIKTRYHRGTNNVGNFHKYYNDLVWSYRSGPLLVYLVALPFIVRWNVRMAGDDLGCVGKSATSGLAHMERALLACDRSLMDTQRRCFIGPISVLPLNISCFWASVLCKCHVLGIHGAERGQRS